MSKENEQKQDSSTAGASGAANVIKRGARVLITGKHPWTGHTGTVSEEMQTPVGTLWRVNLDNGMDAGCKLINLKAL